MYNKLLYTFLVTFCYRWDQLFTLVEKVQLTAWYHMVGKCDELELMVRRDEKTVDHEEFESWEDVR